MKLFGLGLGHIGYLGSAACFSPAQLYQLALSAGFAAGTEQDTGSAGTMAAIAMRESNGCPDLTNLRAPKTTGPLDPGEHSYGLWQINVDTSGLLASFGLTDPNQLLDPVANAQAAYSMWGGNDNNLDVAWYIFHPDSTGAYRKQYLANLAVVRAAVDGSTTDVPGLGNDIVPVDDGSGDISMGIVLGGLAVTLGLLFLIDRR